MSNSNILVNPHGTMMWRMDAGQFSLIAVKDGKQGFNIKGSNGNGKGSDVWIDVDEAKSLRDWLNANLPA